MDFLPIDNRTIGGKHDKWELPKKKEICDLTHNGSVGREITKLG